MPATLDPQQTMSFGRSGALQLQNGGNIISTYFGVEGDESEALHWLRRAIYLGNENYPWFSKNPAWRNLQGHADFERILEDLRKSYRRNHKNWKRLLAQVRD